MFTSSERCASVCAVLRSSSKALKQEFIISNILSCRGMFSVVCDSVVKISKLKKAFIILERPFLAASNDSEEIDIVLL
jgi:hypothetical protein